MVKNLSANTQEMWVQSQGREDLLVKSIATHSVFLPGKSNGQRSLAGYSSIRVRHDWRDFSQFSRWSCPTLPPHRLQHARLPSPSQTPRACTNSCPSGQWCHPTILSSVIPLSSCPQSFPASGSFPLSQFFKSGGQTIGVSASASVLPMNTQDWSSLGQTGWISLQSKELSSLFQHHSSKASVLQRSAFLF